jgi:hypothetical protein
MSTASRVSSAFCRFTLTLVVIIVGGGFPAATNAQEVGRMDNITATGVPYYVYAESGEPTIQVYVVGGGAGGVYEIGVGTRFDTFLALAAIGTGAASPGSRQNVTVRLYRTSEVGERQMLLEGRAEELVQADPNTYPRLQDGDFVNVEVRSSQRFGWRDGLSILTSITSLVVLFERFGVFGAE